MRRVVTSLVAFGLLMSAGAGVAFADKDNGTDAFICPVVGEGAINAGRDAHAYLGGGATFLPGNEQAGTHANESALNERGAPAADNRPGADGFTPIWNP
jgi:hypothetical protein